MRIAVLAAFAVCLQTGCDRAAEPASKPAASTEAAPAPAAAPAAAPIAIMVPSGKFDAISNTAMGITGDLAAADGGFAFSQGQAYSLAGAGEVKAADPYATTGASFSSLINIPDAAELRLFRVIKEDPAKARNGGLCGADPATFIVTHEGVDSTGGPALFLLAFKGAAPPSSTSPETDLCGTFMYAPAAGGPATK
jgi:hypothetical protein